MTDIDGRSFGCEDVQRIKRRVKHSVYEFHRAALWNHNLPPQQRLRVRLAAGTDHLLHQEPRITLRNMWRLRQWSSRYSCGIPRISPHKLHHTFNRAPLQVRWDIDRYRLKIAVLKQSLLSLFLVYNKGIYIAQKRSPLASLQHSNQHW